MFRRITRMGLVASMAAVMAATAHAQTNIDQGKSPAEIFANACATCHKSVRGLAAGKNSLMLSSFLREHYTSSRDQASALAAYVLSAGGNEPASRQKPEAERARAAGEEPKTGEPKNATRPVRVPAKPEEEETKPAERSNPTDAEKKGEPKPATATREEKRPEEAAPAKPEEATAVRQPVSVAATPAAGQTSSPVELPGVGPTTTAAVPVQSQPNEIPRDNIPD